MPAVMFDDEDPQIVPIWAVVDSVGETPHDVTSEIVFHDRPTLWRVPNCGNRRVKLLQKAPAQPGHPPLVEPSSLEQFRFGVRMVN